MGRSGQFFAYNDCLIIELLADSRYEVRPDGTVWRISGGNLRQTGKAKTNKKGKLYHHLMYRGRMLLVHRIVFRKFNGQLRTDLVVNHIDGNGLNNLPANLELVTQSTNISHSYQETAS